MKASRRVYSSKNTQQIHIVTLFCTIIAIVLVALILLRSTSAQAAPAEERYKYYTSIRVNAGDTLWQIAGEHMTEDYKDIHEYMNEICSINHISKDEIQTGQYLVIPYYSSDYIE